jgi:hypothetical protein
LDGPAPQLRRRGTLLSRSAHAVRKGASLGADATCTLRTPVGHVASVLPTLIWHGGGQLPYSDSITHSCPTETKVTSARRWAAALQRPHYVHANFGRAHGQHGHSRATCTRIADECTGSKGTAGWIWRHVGGGGAAVQVTSGTCNITFGARGTEGRACRFVTGRDFN